MLNLLFIVYIFVLIYFGIMVWIYYLHTYESPKKTIYYQQLLERPFNYIIGDENISQIDINEQLVYCLEQFCIENKLFSKPIILSLSGGVDSMVVLACLIKLRKYHNFEIHTVSINYNQRDEQSLEIQFIQDYTKHHNVFNHVAVVEGYSRKKLNSGPRTEFEEESRKIRFDLYKKVMNETNSSGVFVGHHKDDIIENIFTNSMKGCNILDMEVMKYISCIHSVNIYRPFLHFHKSSIYDFAHKYNIPYFLDTTPKWSRRGKMRNEIFPLLDSVFSPSWRLKLKNIGDQSNEWNDYINNYIINPWMNEISFQKYGFIVPIKNQPRLIYNTIIMKSMHKFGHNMLKQTSMDKLMMYIDKKTLFTIIPLEKSFYLYIMDNQFIIFDKNPIQQKILNTSNNDLLLSDENIYDYKIEHFLNGNLSYKCIDNENDTFVVNKHIYKQIKINIPSEIAKMFVFKNISTCKQFINFP